MSKVFTCGKYRGRTHEEIADLYPSYIVWAYECANSTFEIDKSLYLACIDSIEESTDKDGLREAYDRDED